MESLRWIFTWVNRHKKLSIFILIFTFVLVVSVRRFVSLNEGVLTPALKKGTIIQAVYGIGTVTALRSYSLKPGVTSHITELYVKEGDSVKRGAKLAMLDQLVATAPFEGTVTYLPFKVGENVFAQQPMLTLVDLQNRYMMVSMEQQGALKVIKGLPVEMSFDSYRENTYQGKVEAVYSNENNFLARIDVSELSPNILPGMTADVAIQITKHDNALLLPVAALEKSHVWVKKSGHGIPQKIEVKLGIVDKDMAEILSGDLEEGDVLVIKKKVN